MYTAITAYLGLHTQYLLANFSISLSIFCASPGSRKFSKNNLSADTKSLFSKFIKST